MGATGYKTLPGRQLEGNVGFLTEGGLAEYYSALFCPLKNATHLLILTGGGKCGSIYYPAVMVADPGWSFMPDVLPK